MANNLASADRTKMSLNAILKFTTSNRIFSIRKLSGSPNVTRRNLDNRHDPDPGTIPWKDCVTALRQDYRICICDHEQETTRPSEVLGAARRVKGDDEVRPPDSRTCCREDRKNMSFDSLVPPLRLVGRQAPNMWLMLRCQAKKSLLFSSSEARPSSLVLLWTCTS